MVDVRLLTEDGGGSEEFLFYSCAKCMIYRKMQQYKMFLGDSMTINDIAVVRTGLVTARKKKDAAALGTYKYQLLNLRCIANEGYIDKDYIEPYELSEELKDDYLTRMGDILIRLSAPYTAVMIPLQSQSKERVLKNKNWCHSSVGRAKD